MMYTNNDRTAQQALPSGRYSTARQPARRLCSVLVCISLVVVACRGDSSGASVDVPRREAARLPIAFASASEADLVVSTVLDASSQQSADARWQVLGHALLRAPVQAVERVLQRRSGAGDTLAIGLLQMLRMWLQADDTDDIERLVRDARRGEGPCQLGVGIIAVEDDGLCAGLVRQMTRAEVIEMCAWLQLRRELASTLVDGGTEERLARRQLAEVLDGALEGAPSESGR